MELNDIIKEILRIAEDAESAAGCSHEDALQDGLIYTSDDLKTLAKQIKKTSNL